MNDISPYVTAHANFIHIVQKSPLSRRTEELQNKTLFFPPRHFSNVIYLFIFLTCHQSTSITMLQKDR